MTVLARDSYQKSESRADQAEDRVSSMVLNQQRDAFLWNLYWVVVTMMKCFEGDLATICSE